VAYDADLADRVREASATRPGSARARMFGGLGSMWAGVAEVEGLMLVFGAIQCQQVALNRTRDG
jgi:hypothetical protein